VGSDDEPITIKAIGDELELDKQPAYRRVQMALEDGFLKNLEDRKGRPAKLVLGDPLPDDQEILPDPKELGDSFTVLGFSEGVNAPPPL
jgi:hypothetical protein